MTFSEPRALYNEIDPYAAQWLRNLISGGHIAPGDVCERDIRDIRPSDLRGYTQFHAFAGIGVWSYAARRAGWPDSRPLWTGSCPCPPFSAAGKGQRCPLCGSARNICHPRKTGHFVCLDCGCDRHADDRHLWPEFARLIRECDAPTTFGEQVASADGRLWLGTVRADVETMGRALGGADLCAAGVGAPHIRQRLWFVTEPVAHHHRRGWGEQPSEFEAQGSRQGGYAYFFAENSEASRLGHAECIGTGRDAGTGTGPQGGLGLRAERDDTGSSGSIRGLADAYGRNTCAEGLQRGGQYGQQPQDRGIGYTDRRSSPTNGFWGDADWLFCRDGKWRPVRPGSQPLAHGAPARVGRLRGYGNAVDAEATRIFIEAYLEGNVVEIDLEPVRGASATSALLDFEDLL